MSNLTVGGEVLEYFTAVRRELHQIPELGYEEYQTAERIRAELTRLRIDFVAGVDDAPTATVAQLGDTSKPCVALRADIDALPIAEQTGLAYASRHAGKMHACGHDGHTATLLATAATLQPMMSDLPVCVKLLFQPAEEGGGGGGRLVKAGVLDGRVGPRVEAIFGLHGWPALPVGVVSTKPGPLLAATDTFEVTVRGRGCHGAFPHWGTDAVTTAASMVTNLQQFVSRDLDPTQSAVLSVGIFRAGTATNVIPDVATFSGTARTLTDATRTKLRESVQRRVKGVAEAGGCEAQVQWTDGYPPTVNDPRIAGYVAQVARDSLGEDRFIPTPYPTMGGEDFSYYLEQVPGCFFLIGVMPPGRSEYPALHNDHFDFTDGAIETGVHMFVELVRRFSLSHLDAR